MPHKSQFSDWVSWVKGWHEWTIEVGASLCRDINFQKMIWYVLDLDSRPVHIETWHMSGWLGMEQLVMRLGEEGRDIMWICNMQHIITRSLSPGAPPTLTNIHKHNRQYYSRSSFLTDTHKTCWRSSTCGLHPRTIWSVRETGWSHVNVPIDAESAVLSLGRCRRGSTSSRAPSFYMT